MKYPAEDNSFLSEHVDLMSFSYLKLLGEKLILANNTNVTLAKALFYAPFVVVSHNIAVDPIFNYANLKALELFGFTWEEFTRLPSRMSAEPMHRHDRERLLAEVSQKGFSKDYQGVRVTKTGAKFLIKNAVVWNLSDDKGHYAGQAARFEDWQFL